ncbi:MAG: SDR family NAD(P)-dependent oxidoreductase, partial [Verrucomicrobiota bacterium]
MSESASLAIIGISCIFPKSDDLQAYWSTIKNGVDAITPVPERTHWKAEDYFNADPKAPDHTYAQRGGFISPVPFNPMEAGIAPKDIEATDTTQLLGMVAAKQALVDAGYGEKAFDRTRTSVILGVTGALELVIPLGARLGHPIWRRALKEAGVEKMVAEDVVQRISDSYVGWQENSFPGLLGNVAAGRIANRLDLGGTNCVVDAACASSMAALHLACMELTTGRADMVITGGIDTFNDIFMYMCFSKTPALSPSGDAKPFDRSCDGTILGEGLGMLVLKRLADAERDGDKIYAVLQGIGSSSDGRGNAIYAPRADGQKEALQRAYADAKVSPDSIDLVEAHGTGTKVGDATELQALTEVYRAARPAGSWAALGSVKSQIGHSKAAAGVAGLIKAALALHHKVLPPTIKVTQPIDEAAPGKSPFYINTQKRPWLPKAAHPRRAGVSAFGFGGTNFHCVLEEHGVEKTQPDWDGNVEIVAFGGNRLEDLRAEIAGFPVDLPWNEFRQRARQARQAFQSSAKFRVLLPVSKETAWTALRDSALKMLEQHPEKTSWVLPSGVAFGSGDKHGKLGALFPGQGSQYPGMLRDLACQFPGMLTALTEANRVFTTEQPERGDGAQPLSDFIYPHPAFTDEAKRAQEEALKATQVAQPALGAVSLGALNVVTLFGVTPEAAAGHSYGELLALCGAGRLTPESLHQISNVRGRLMASRNGHSDRGAMLAVQATEEVVTSYLKEQNSPLVIANRNSPKQFVLAGPRANVEQAAAEFTKRSIRARVLPVSAAFHSALVADACEPFAAALKEVAFSQAKIPVYANSTAKAYPDGAKQARELLANQIVKPVDFTAQIETMYADGVTTFLELGPGHVLSDLVQAILQGRNVETIALDASRGTRSGVFDLAAALCRLTALGHAVDLAHWENYTNEKTIATSGKPNLTIPISGANTRTQRATRPAVASAPVTKPIPSPMSVTPSTPAPMVPSQSSAPLTPAALPKTALPSDLAAALQVAQQGMLSLQKLQEQTAQLHRQFLENQESARRTLEALLLQRRELLDPSSAGTQRSPAPVLQPLAPSSAPVTQPVVVSAQPAPASVKPEPKPTTDTSVQASAVARTVLEVVAEKTGYPAEMLNLGMGLDSDLGIDSIKRVEIMATLRGRLPGAPEIKPEHLGTLQTLQQVVDFLAAGQTATVPAVPVSLAAVSPAAAVGYAHASDVLLKVVAEKTGYPVEMLNLDMGMDSDLGVDSIKRVEIMAAVRAQLPSAPEIKPEHLGTLQTLKQVVEFLTAGTKEIAAPTGTPAPVVPTSAVNFGTASEVLLKVVAEKTGYPVEMLNLDMGMDSDLGVDSIKRVEIMAAVRAQLPSAPEIKPEHLGTLQTLKQVVEFLTARPEKSSLPVKESAPGSTKPAAPILCAPANLELNRQVVRPMELHNGDARTAITLPRHALFWVTEDGSGLAEAIEKQLKQMGYMAQRGTPAELMASKQDHPSGVVLLWPAARASDTLLKESFRLIQMASPTLRKSKKGTPGILVSVSRLDGVFGFGTLNGKSDPVSGGLAGLIKTARHEWPEVHCKAIDLDAETCIGAEMAERIVEEMFRTGPVEVGLAGKGRFGLHLETVPFSNNGNGNTPVLKQGDVIVVTGGARGITAAATLQLAQMHRPQLVLLGRSQLTESEPEWLAGITDEMAVKKALVVHANGDRAPKVIEARFRDVMAQREIREQLRKIQVSGAQARYRAVDVRNTAEVKTLLDEIRRELGPVKGLIHGAGVLADRRIEDKTEEQFELVYSTKVSGLKNLLAAVTADELKLLALFSSYTGRFGRTGQVDYAAANEVMNKIAQVESRRRPQCRVVSFNWGPWNGGMVSEGLRKIFESEGVGLIEPDAGAQFFVREVSTHGDHSVEVLALAPAPSHKGNGNGNGNGFHGAVSSATPNVAFEREVSVQSLPCLASHV